MPPVAAREACILGIKVIVVVAVALVSAPFLLAHVVDALARVHRCGTGSDCGSSTLAMPLMATGEACILGIKVVVVVAVALVVAPSLLAQIVDALARVRRGGPRGVRCGRAAGALAVSLVAARKACILSVKVVVVVAVALVTAPLFSAHIVDALARVCRR